MDYGELHDTDCVVINGKYFVPYGYRKFTHVVAIKTDAGWIPSSWHRSEVAANRQCKRIENQAIILKAGQEHYLD